MSLLAAVGAPLLLFLAGCAAGSSNPIEQAATERLANVYKQVRMAEVCADHRVGLAGGTRGPELAAERDRLNRLLSDASRSGLGDVIGKAEREWQHFQAVADWICPEPSGVEQFRSAVDLLSAAIDAAARVRR